MELGIATIQPNPVKGAEETFNVSFGTTLTKPALIEMIRIAKDNKLKVDIVLEV